jgi:hypothetical protein
LLHVLVDYHIRRDRRPRSVDQEEVVNLEEAKKREAYLQGAGVTCWNSEVQQLIKLTRQ